MDAACSSGDMGEFSSDILLKCAEATAKIIPSKSSGRYDKEYQLFCDWRKVYQVENIVNESIMLAYFLDASKNLSSSTLWAKYSMAKSTLMVSENVDISKFLKLTVFLKKQSVGYQSNKSKVFMREEINKFIKEAPTKEYLLVKVVAMLGIAGGCRREELYNFSVDDVEDTGPQLVVTISHTKTYGKRVFTVINECDEINFLDLYRKYRNLHPKNMAEKALFIGYRRGKCISQRIGIHTIGGTPKKIAGYLKLKHPERYTGHCFRSTSAALLANAGAAINVLKRHGGCKSSSVAEKYVEESIEGKKKVARMIQGGEIFVHVLQQHQEVSTTTVTNDGGMPAIKISENSNCTITANINR